jgi:hypothetical protein
MKTSNKLLSTALLIVCALILGMIQYSKFFIKDQVKLESGHEIVKNNKLEYFTKVNIASNFDISIYKGPESIILEGDSILIENLMMEIKDSVLTLSLNDKIQNYSSSGLKIKIYCNQLNEISLLGSGDITMQDTFKSSFSKLILTGSGSIVGKFSSEIIDVSLLGSGEIRNEGNSNHTSATLSGSGDIDLSKTIAQTCTSNLLGSGNIEINCLKTLDIDLTGNGEINYKGTPKLNIKKLGNGEVHAID